MSRILENVLKSAKRLKEAGLIEPQAFQNLKEACSADEQAAATKSDRR